MMTGDSMIRLCVFPACLLVAAAAGGCGAGDWSLRTKAPAVSEPQAVPGPIDLLLPKSIKVHPFTGRTFDEAGGVSGIDVRIQAIDHYGDPTKAFGNFRFEIYQFLPNHLDPKGKRLATWDESLLDPKKNLLHWEKMTQMYDFKLQWDEPIPVGRRLVLLVTFDSPFTDRMTDQREFVSGQ